MKKTKNLNCFKWLSLWLLPFLLSLTAAAKSPELVDLGLSVRWADMNIAAATMTDYGGYYAWGETATKPTYTWANYAWCDGTETTCHLIGDDISRNISYDRAYKLNPTMWLPTVEQWEELISKCTWKAATIDGVKGYNVTGPSGNSIFLPFSGCSYEGGDHDVGSSAYYWTANNVSDDNSKGRAGYIKSGSKAKVSTIRRRTGAAIRAVGALMTIELVDLGLSVKWANKNIDANDESDYGGYYAWGERWIKETYTWNNYSWCSGTEESCVFLGMDISQNMEFDLAYDYNPRMSLPTAAQWKELISKCTWTSATVDGVKGYKVKGPSGKTIFLPFSGCSYDGEDHNVGSSAYYWTANNVPDDNSKGQAAYLKSGSSTKVGTIRRRTGAAIRAVGDDSSVAVKSITLDTNVLMMTSGEMVGMSYSFTPEDADVSALTWTSSNGSVAVVSREGVVTARGEGTCTISVSYGGDVKEECVVVVDNETGSSDGHGYVDLGLPSGTLWATANLGAENLEETGGYFQWGETLAQDPGAEPFTWTNYGLCTGNGSSQTKYCSQFSLWAGAGDPDCLKELDPQDDAANATWGVYWRTPSLDQFKELVSGSNTVSTRTKLNGVDGCLITSRVNGKSIFLPAASGYLDGTHDDSQGMGCYWSRTLSEDDASAYGMCFTASSLWECTPVKRCNGLTIRPVYEGIGNSSDLNITPTSLDFGSVAVGSSRSMSLKIRNNTFESRVIIPFDLKTEDFNVDWMGGEIPPNTTQKVTVTYSPTKETVVAGGSFPIATAQDSSLVSVSARSHKGSRDLTSRSNLVVWCKDGSKVFYSLNDEPIVTIKDGVWRIDSKTVDVEYGVNDVLKFTYEGFIEGIQEIETDGKKPFDMDSEALTFFSDKEDLHVRIVTISGIVTSQFVARKGASATMPLNQFTPGVYVISVNKTSYKIIIR